MELRHPLTDFPLECVDFNIAIFQEHNFANLLILSPKLLFLSRTQQKRPSAVLRASILLLLSIDD
jgi:hypothetical protein